MPLQLNLPQARVIDPVLTNIVLGYTNAELVGNFLFPAVPVDVSAGKVIQFDKAGFRLYESQRAPGTNSKRIAFGYQGNPYVLENHALEAVVPREHQRDAQATVGVNLSSSACLLVMEAMRLKLEYQQAQLATTAANYGTNTLTLSGTSKWSDPNSTPEYDMRAARETVRSNIGRYPNTLLLSAKAYSALAYNPTIVDKFKYTSSASITEQMLANYFHIERVVVGKGVYADDSDTLQDIWGNNAVLAFVPTQQVQSIHQPSFGYTYTMRGNPLVETGYWDPRAKSWVFGVEFERAPLLTGISSGFLIQNVA